MHASLQHAYWNEGGLLQMPYGNAKCYQSFQKEEITGPRVMNEGPGRMTGGLLVLGVMLFVLESV